MFKLISAFAFATLAVSTAPAWAVETYQSATGIIIECPMVEDTNPFAAIVTGSVAQVEVEQVGGANDGYCVAAGGAFTVAHASCAPVATTYTGAGAFWELTSVAVPADATGLRVTCNASDGSAQEFAYPIRIDPSDRDTVAADTLVDTGTTIPASLAAAQTDLDTLTGVATEARLAELDAANLPTDIAAVKAETALIVADTQDFGGATYAITASTTTSITSAALGAAYDDLVGRLIAFPSASENPSQGTCSYEGKMVEVTSESPANQFNWTGALGGAPETTCKVVVY